MNQVVETLEACTAESIEWASTRDLQSDTAKMEAALFTRRTGHKMHLQPKLTVKIQVGYSFFRFNEEAMRSLGVWMDAHLSFKEHHNRCMKEAGAADARLRVLKRMHGIVPQCVRAVQIACVQAVALYGFELWRNPQEIGRRGDLQLLLNWQARSILGALPMTPMGELRGESGLTPAPVTLDARQQRLTARLASECAGSKLNAVHNNPTSGTPICRVTSKKHEQ